MAEQQTSAAAGWVAWRRDGASRRWVAVAEADTEAQAWGRGLDAATAKHGAGLTVLPRGVNPNDRQRGRS